MGASTKGRSAASSSLASTSAPKSTSVMRMRSAVSPQAAVAGGGGTGGLVDGFGGAEPVSSLVGSVPGGVDGEGGVSGVFGVGGVGGFSPGVLGDGVLGGVFGLGVFGLGVFGLGGLVEGEPGGAGLLGVTGGLIPGSVDEAAEPLHPDNSPAIGSSLAVARKPGISQRLSAILRVGFGQ